jgi:ADP-heptose:LPS heptosyltransferase
LATTPTVADLASVIARCDLFVGLDSGPMHLAGALGAPVVAIWGPGNQHLFGPRWPQSRVVTHRAICEGCPQEGKKPVRCAMGYTRETVICVAPITTDEVFEAASGLLQTRGLRHDARRTRDARP